MEIDLSNMDMSELAVSGARHHMRMYRENSGSKNAWAYLHVAETNLIGADQSRSDVQTAYQELRELRANSS